MAIEDRTNGQPAPTAFPHVEVPGVGPVSLATLDELRGARDSASTNADHLARQAAELDGLAEDRVAEAGAFLVTHRSWWDVPPELSPLVARAERLVTRIAWLDEQTGGLEPGGRPGPNAVDLASTLRGWWSGMLRAGRAHSAAGLRRTLVRIAGTAAGVDVPDVEALLDQAAELRARAGGLRTVLASVVLRLGTLDREIAAREQTERSLGVDALQLAVYARTYGLPVAPCPFELEPGEVAHLLVEAELGRMPAGRLPPHGGPAPGVPMAHTGIRHWIGGLRNGPAPRAAGAPADTGTLVVSNLRLLFVGQTGALAFPLTGVVEVDVFTDGIAVLGLGREAPALFLSTAPGLVALYLNWALLAAAG